MLLDKTTVSFIMNSISQLIESRMKQGNRKKQNATDEVIGGIGRFINTATSIESKKDNGDLVERCKEILSWKKTGVLDGDVLRTMAREIQTTFPISMGEALNVAETRTFEECLTLIIERFSTSLVDIKPGTVIPSKKDGFWTYTLRIDDKVIPVEDVWPFESMFASAAEAKRAMREKCGIKVG